MGMGGGVIRDGSRRLDRVMDEVSEGTQGDMLLGLVMGFVFGIIMLFWIWERGIPRRQKLGILCGIACNLTVSPAPATSPCRKHKFCFFRVEGLEFKILGFRVFFFAPAYLLCTALRPEGKVKRCIVDCPTPTAQELRETSERTPAFLTALPL